MKKILFILISLLGLLIVAQAQPILLGLTDGNSSLGSITTYNSANNSLNAAFRFQTTGSQAFGSLHRASDGKYYGMTYAGGTSNKGVIFSFNVATSVVNVVKNFTSIDGANAYGSVLQALDGKLYGMTVNGGSSGKGVIFSFDLSTSIHTVVKNFDNITGANPYGTLLQASNGKLYGLATSGGGTGHGVIFSFDPATSVYTVVHSFNNLNGQSPFGSLIQASDGKLYGMSRSGGTAGYGVIFSFDPSTEVYTVVKNFDNTNGRGPHSSLIQASDNKLYGMTQYGGSSGNGVIFSFNLSSSAYTVLKNFDYTNGGNPTGSLIQASDGKLYGMTRQGGAFGVGVAFSFDAASLAYVKADFNGTNGAYPNLGSFVEIPAIANLSPYRNMLAVPPSSNVAVTLNRNFESGSAGENSVVVWSMQSGGKKAGSNTLSGNNNTFNPLTDFKPGEVVFATTTTASGLARPHFYQFNIAAAAAAATFTGSLNINGGSGSYSGGVSDMNGDGHIDVLIPNIFNSSVTIKFNDGTGAFPTSTNVSVGAGPVGVMGADIDNDGDMDLLASNSSANSVSVRLNDGVGNFNGSTNVPVGAYPESVAAADIDGDGDLDILTGNYFGNSVSVVFNNGTGLFTSLSNVPVAAGAYIVTTADIDNDGDLDILSSSFSTNRVSVRFNDGNGVFSGTTSVLVGANPYGLTMADIDNDLDLDMLVANYGGTTISVCFNNGLGEFSATGNVVVGSRPRNVSAVDVDGDGDLDLLVANNGSNTVSVRLNDGYGSFTGTTNVAVGSGPMSIAGVDIDNDADLDIVSLNHNTFSIRFNENLSINTTTALISSLNPSTYGETLILTSTVSSVTGIPTGNVIFKNGSSILGAAMLTTVDGVQKASFSISTLQANTIGHSITAVYEGQGLYTSSTSSAVLQVVNPKTLTVILQGSITKEYDGNMGAAILPENYLLDGLVGSDDVILNNPTLGLYTTKSVGMNKQVTVNGLGISGASSLNYTVSGSVSANIGRITHRLLVIGILASNKVYDGNPNADIIPNISEGLVPGDLVTVEAGGGLFNNKDVGNGKPVTGIVSLTGGVDAGNYQYIPSVSSSANITPAGLTVVNTSRSKVYGATLGNADFAGSITGIQAGDNITVTRSSTGSVATATVAGSTYPIVGTLADPGNRLANYDVTNLDGALTVERATLTVVNTSRSKVYGTTLGNADFAGSITGIQAGDNITVTRSSTGSVATATVAGSAYPIVGTLADPGNRLANYDVTNLDGALTVERATLTVVNTSRSKVYGATLGNADFAGSITGIQAGDNITVTRSSTGSVATATVAGSTYPIVGTLADPGNRLANYDVTNLDGALTVERATLTVVNTSRSKVYGTTLGNADFAGSITGIQAGDNITVTRSSTGSVATATVAGSTYPIVGTLADPGNRLANYDVTNLDGALTVERATLTVVNTSRSKVYGATLGNADFAGSITGIQAGDNITVTRSSTGSVATATVAGSTYPIVGTLADPGNRLGNYDVTNVDGALTVTKAAITVFANGFSRQYSDPNPSFTGSLLGVLNNDGIFASYSTTANIMSGPGNYLITPLLNDPNTKLNNYSVSSTNGLLTIIQENARVDYTGIQFVATSCATCASATVLLRATVQDISVPTSPADPLYDLFAGDIRNAKVKFVNRDNNTDISNWINVSTLINPADLRTGTVTFSYPVTLASNETGKLITVGMIVDNGYYIRNNSLDNTVITVYKPVSEFITGGGHIIPTQSSGSYASDAGVKTNFGINVKFNQNGSQPKGNVNIIIRRTVSGVLRTYQIKSNAINSVGIGGTNAHKRGQFISKANLTDITNPLSTISLGGNLDLNVTMSDKGEPGNQDSIGVTLYGGAGLMYSSNWVVSRTKEKELAGGNIVVKGVNIASTATRGTSVEESAAQEESIPITKKTKDAEMSDHLIVEVFPNPSNNQFAIRLTSAAKGNISVKVMNSIGTVIEQRSNVNTKGNLILGAFYRPGTYFVEVQQGKERRQLKLVKL